MKSTFFHVSIVIISLVLLTFATLNLTTLQNVSRQIEEIATDDQENIDEQETVEVMNEERVEEEFASLLYEKKYYDYPFGAAEVEGYFTTVERETSLDGSSPSVICSAFVVTDGPETLMATLQNSDRTTAVLGSEDSFFGDNIQNSTKDQPVRVVVTLNPIMEGELIGCMRWPFSSILEIE